MELQEALDFLNRNTDTLTWIGTGLAASAAGAWAILKFFWPRSSGPKDQAAQRPQQVVGPITVTDSPYTKVSVTQKIVRTLSGVALFIFWMCLLILLIIAAVQVSERYATAIPSLPTVEVSLTCGYRHREHSVDEDGGLRTYGDPSEMQSLNDLLKVATEYTDQVIMVTLEIWDDDRGDCFRLMSSSELATADGGEASEDEEGSGTIEMSIINEPWTMGDIAGYLLVNAFHPDEWAASIGFFFPPANRIPDTSLYVKRTAPGGTRLLDYGGPFVVRHDYDTRWGYIALYPVTDRADYIERRMKCTYSQLSFFEKLVMNCVPPTPTNKPEE